MLKLISFLSFFLLIALSCRKNLPQIPDATAPVFYIELNSTELNMQVQAGVDDVLFDVERENRFGAIVMSSFLTSDETQIQASFYADEIFSSFTLQDFLNLNNFGLAFQNNASISSLSASDLSLSLFDEISFELNNAPVGNTLNIIEPGKHKIITNSEVNGISSSIENEVVVGFNNPYQFKLEAQIITGGPTDILSGMVSENTSPIQRIEWQTGSNTETTIGENSILFPPFGSGNNLVAQVYFQDGTIRRREVTFGFQNAPKIEDYVYIIESNSTANFSNRINFEVEFENENWSSRLATDYSQGTPYLNVEEIVAYTEPITKRNLRMVKANGLIYLKNQATQVTSACQITLNLGFELE